MRTLGFFGTPLGITALLVAVLAPDVYVDIVNALAEITSALFAEHL